MFQISSKFIFLILIALAVGLEVFADIFFKKWSMGSKNIILYLGLLFYFIGTIFWAISLKYEYLSRAVSIFTIINLIAVALVGLVYFKEDLSLINKSGILLGIISIALIEL